MSATLTQGASLTAAYGKVYRTSGDIVDDFEKGKDFVYNGTQSGGKYCSIRDFVPGVEVQLRYGNKHQHVKVYTTK